MMTNYAMTNYSPPRSASDTGAAFDRESKFDAGPEFDDAFRRRLNELFVWRRDVRRFRADAVPPGTLERLIALALLSPSVGLAEPWRFVVVDDPSRRARVREAFAAANAQALASYAGERAAAYARLKLAGLEEAPCQFAVFADRETAAGHGLGRRTMPETAEYSAVAAVAMMWLAARAEGIGMGWVSILDPARINAILDVPAAWRFIGYFCLGYPQAESDAPELARAGWGQRCDPAAFVLRR
jgi:5,6-dimethylbenzimidazole synthase